MLCDLVRMLRVRWQETHNTIVKLMVLNSVERCSLCPSPTRSIYWTKASPRPQTWQPRSYRFSTLSQRLDRLHAFRENMARLLIPGIALVCWLCVRAASAHQQLGLGGPEGFGSGLVPRQNELASKSSCLNSSVIQRASSLTGQEDGTHGVRSGQSKSNT
jgi:hypothetical protein